MLLLSFQPRWHLLWEAFASPAFLPSTTVFFLYLVNTLLRSLYYLFVCFLIFMFWTWWIYLTLKKQQKILLTGWPSHLLYNTAKTIPGSSFKLPLGAALRHCMTQPALSQPSHRKGRSRWTSGQGGSQFCGKTKVSLLTFHKVTVRPKHIGFISLPLQNVSDVLLMFMELAGFKTRWEESSFTFQIWSPVSHLLKLSGKCHDFLFIFYLLANNKLYEGKKSKKKAKA